MRSPLALCAVLLLGLVACGGSSSDEPEGGNAPETSASVAGVRPGEFASSSLPIEGTLGGEAWSVDATKRSGQWCLDVLAAEDPAEMCPPESEVTSENYDAVQLMVFRADGDQRTGLFVGVVPPDSDSMALVGTGDGWTLAWNRPSGVFAMVGPISDGHEGIRVSQNGLTAECALRDEGLAYNYSCPSPTNADGEIIGVPR